MDNVQFIEKFWTKQYVVVYIIEGNILILLSKNIKPTKQDIEECNSVGLDYDRINWDCEIKQCKIVKRNGKYATKY